MRRLGRGADETDVDLGGAALHEDGRGVGEREGQDRASRTELTEGRGREAGGERGRSAVEGQRVDRGRGAHRDRTGDAGVLLVIPTRDGGIEVGRGQRAPGKGQILGKEAVAESGAGSRDEDVTADG